jgi:hypothetical protein
MLHTSHNCRKIFEKFVFLVGKKPRMLHRVASASGPDGRRRPNKVEMKF